MSVTRIHEDPRVTRPYTDAQWAAIDALGERVDADLAAGDVRLTQGGEPTFVVDRRHGRPRMELHGDVAGEARARRNAAAAAARRASRRGGLLHFGQGKWYPGEPLPRWALGVYWRADGEPLWHDDALLADARVPGTRDDRRRRARSSSARAKRLGFPAGYVLTAYEDVPKVLLDESALPDNVDPLDADLSQPGERARIARLLRAGIDKPAGFVLPLKAVDEAEASRHRVGDEPVAAAPRAALRGRRRFAARLPACRSRRCRTCCRKMSSTIPSRIRSRRREGLRKRDATAVARAAARAAASRAK